DVPGARWKTFGALEVLVGKRVLGDAESDAHLPVKQVVTHLRPCRHQLLTSALPVCIPSRPLTSSRSRCRLCSICRTSAWISVRPALTLFCFAARSCSSSST